MKTPQRNTCRFAMKKHCPLEWKDLSAFAGRNKPYCETCGKHITSVRTKAEFEEEAKYGHCVAVLPDQWQDGFLQNAVFGYPDENPFRHKVRLLQYPDEEL